MPNEPNRSKIVIQSIAYSSSHVTPAGMFHAAPVESVAVAPLPSDNGRLIVTGVMVSLAAVAALHVSAFPYTNAAS